MVTIHADTRRASRSADNLSQYRKPSSIFLVVLAILSILPFVALGGGGGTLAVTIVLPASFIIKIGGPSIYQAFITGGNGVPFFTESNFTQLVNDDILSRFDFKNVRLPAQEVISEVARLGGIAMPCHPGRPTIGLMTTQVPWSCRALIWPFGR